MFKVAILLTDTRLSFSFAIYISKPFEQRASSIINAVLAWLGIVSHMLLYSCSLLFIHLCVCVCVCVWVCLQMSLRVYVLFRCARAREWVVGGCGSRLFRGMFWWFTIVYAHKIPTPHPRSSTSLFHVGRQAISINHSFVRSLVKKVFKHCRSCSQDFQI